MNLIFDFCALEGMIGFDDICLSVREGDCLNSLLPGAAGRAPASPVSSTELGCSSTWSPP